MTVEAVSGHVAALSGLGPDDAYGTSRSSPLFPGTALVHADLHNHSLLSDGEGEPRDAFSTMRRSGLDVAALTDHVNVVDDHDLSSGMVLSQLVGGLDEERWPLVAEMADAALEEGTFVTFRGFEWSHPQLGHMSVWDSERLVHPRREEGQDIASFLRWLADSATTLAGYNHPGGRGAARFSDFELLPAMVERLVSLELFNKRDDYLFEGTDAGLASPLVHCLGQGWRPGLLGASDEHGKGWGAHDGKGRSGLFVRELTRAGVREALLARRSFATNTRGLRFGVTIGGAPMGGTLAWGRGPAEVVVDVDLGPLSWGRRLSVQVLRPGEAMPAIAAVHGFTVPGPDRPPLTFSVDLDLDGGDWVVLRLSDPLQPADRRATGDYAILGRSLAYASPVWLAPPAG